MDFLKILQDSGGHFFSAGRWAIQKIFSGKKLNESILVIASPSADALRIDCLANTAQVWIKIVNFSPFAFKIDHCIVRLNYAGFSAQMMPDRKDSVPAFSHRNIYVQVNLSSEQGKASALADKNQIPRLEYNLTLASKILTCEKYGGLENVPYDRVNAKLVA